MSAPARDVEAADAVANWWCYTDESFGGGYCDRTSDGCNHHRDVMRETHPEAGGSTCTSYRRAACFRARNNLQEANGEFCSPSVGACRTSSDYMKANAAADYTVLVECRPIE